MTAVFIAALLGIGIYRCGKGQIAQLDYLIWQHRCLRYEAPPGLLVYTDDREEAIRLLSGVAGYRSAHIGHLPTTDSSWRAVGHLPPPLRFPKDGWVSNVYLHARGTGDNRWLAMVGLQVHPSGSGRRLQLYAFSRCVIRWKPLTKFVDPGGGGGTHLNFELTDTDRLRLYAGQSDPNDAARMTISYDLNGKTGVIEGVQRLDGVLILRVLDGPLNAQRRPVDGSHGVIHAQ